MAAAEDRASDAEIARAAVIHAVASNVGMLAVVVAVNVIIAKRDALTRARNRVVALVRHDDPAHVSAALAGFRRDVCLISHLPAERRPSEP